MFAVCGCAQHNTAKMKLYYLAPASRIKEIAHDCHWLALDGSEYVLVCVRWRDEIHEMQWSNNPDIIRLPHPIFESAAKLGDLAAAHLSKRFTIDGQHTVHDLIKQASLEDAWMRLHVL